MLPENYFADNLGYDRNVPHYQQLPEMHRRLKVDQKPGEPLDTYVARQKSAVLEAKEKYFSGARGMFEFLK